MVRVLLHCALAERSWNPYYGLLAVKLAKSVKGHRLTLQFALWDHFKELEKLNTAQLGSLAAMAAMAVAKFALPLTMIKVRQGREKGQGRGGTEAEWRGARIGWEWQSFALPLTMIKARQGRRAGEVEWV